MCRLMREMTESDLSLVIEIENRAFTHPWPKQAFEEILSHYARVLLLDGKVIGYILYHVILDEAIVLNFAIDPDLHGAGHGDFLFSESLKELRSFGSRVFYLDVRESNAPAIGLYEKYGFSKMGIRKEYYSDPTENAIVMALIQ
jgi:ribosomal-protein-alanine N-acetyltransferase